MARRLPLLSLLLVGFVIPLSCSSKDDDGPSQGTGGSAGAPVTGTGGFGGDLSGGFVCKEFAGLGNCGVDAVTAKTTPVNMLLVLDKSGSMASPPDESSSVSLWDATRSALSTALEDAPAPVSFGLQMYPARDLALDCGGNCCDMPDGEGVDIPIEEGDDVRERIVHMLERTNPGGGTPTAAALARAYSYFSTGAGADLEGDRFVLLATDGGPNCNSGASCELGACTVNIDGQCKNPEVNCCSTNRAGCLDDAETLGQIQLLRGIGVDTFVVGLTGTEQYAEQLDEFAVAGGRPREGKPEKYFKVGAQGSADGLAQVLSEITTQLVQSCDLQLAETPPDLNQVNVAVNCDVIPWGNPPDDKPSGGDGGQGGQGGMSSVDPDDDDANGGENFWWLDESTDPPTVRIGGNICGTIENEGVERIDIVLGCPTVR